MILILLQTPLIITTSNYKNNSDIISRLETSLSQIIDSLAPLKHKTLVFWKNVSWFSTDLSKEKRLLCILEKHWRRTPTLTHLNLFLNQRTLYRKQIKTTKINYYNKSLRDTDKNPKKLFSISNHLLGNTSVRSIPNEPIASLVNEFSNYFHTKVKNIIDLLPSPIVPPPNTSSHSFISLTPPSIPFIEQLLTSVNTSSALDLLSHFLTSKHTHYLAPYYNDVIDQSLSTGIVPSYMKMAYITPIIKQP